MGPKSREIGGRTKKEGIGDRGIERKRESRVENQRNQRNMRTLRVRLIDLNCEMKLEVRIEDKWVKMENRCKLGNDEM